MNQTVPQRGSVKYMYYVQPRTPVNNLGETKESASRVKVNREQGDMRIPVASECDTNDGSFRGLLMNCVLGWELPVKADTPESHENSTELLELLPVSGEWSVDESWRLQEDDDY